MTTTPNASNSSPASPSTVPIVIPRSAASDSKSPVPKLERHFVWDVPFDSVTLAGAVDHIEALVRRGEPSYVITANLNYVMLHHSDPGLAPVTTEAAMVLADGQPIVWRSRLGDSALPERVAGSEMIHRLAERASEKGWGIYFLGGEPGVAQSCADKLKQAHPGMRIAGVESPPYRPLSSDEQAQQDERIRQSGAQLLLVAFGQPKGELWIHENYKRLGIPVSIQLGASFDFIAGTATRAPSLFQRTGMEWFYRMMTDPRRLIPRYASNAWFLAKSLVRDWRTR